MDSEDGSGQDAEATRFARTLNALKRQGSALLVVGAVPDEMYERASRQMLGDERASSPRRRLVISDGPTAGNRLGGTGPTTPEYARVVSRDTAARSVAAASDGTASGPSIGGPKVHHIGSSIAELGRTVTEVIEQFEAASNGLGPAELRVAFDCLSTLEAEYDSETVFRFVHVATNQIRGRTGMGHFRLPRNVDERQVRTYAPLFDAIIELRVDVDTLQQRWHFVEESFVSEWLTVPE